MKFQTFADLIPDSKLSFFSSCFFMQYLIHSTCTFIQAGLVKWDQQHTTVFFLSAFGKKLLNSHVAGGVVCWEECAERACRAPARQSKIMKMQKVHDLGDSLSRTDNNTEQCFARMSMKYRKWEDIGQQDNKPPLILLQVHVLIFTANNY